MAERGADRVGRRGACSPGEPAHAGFAALYYWIMRHVVGMTEMPARGADFFLIDRAVIDAFRRCDERNVSVFALITWLGLPAGHVEYDKQPRAAGRSGWTLARKIKLVVDSVDGVLRRCPMRVCGLLGAALLALPACWPTPVRRCAARRRLWSAGRRRLDHRAGWRCSLPRWASWASTCGAALDAARRRRVFRRAARWVVKINRFFDR